MNVLLDDHQANRIGWPECSVDDRLGPIGTGRAIQAQVSGSLQRLTGRRTPVPALIPDPYRSGVLTQARSTDKSVGFDRITVVRDEMRMELSCVGNDQALPRLSAGQKRRTIASFLGRVEACGETWATVLLVNEESEERLESRCDSEVLRAAGIAAGEEFRCEVVRDGATTSTRLVKLPPRVLSRARIDEIRNAFEDRWDF